MDGVKVHCVLCDTVHLKSYWHQHLLSKSHKTAVRARGIRDGTELREGILIRDIENNLVYDILFAPTSSDYYLKTEASKILAAESIETFFEIFKKGILRRIEEALVLHDSIKCYTKLSVHLEKIAPDDEIMHQDLGLTTKNQVILHGTNRQLWFSKLVDTLKIKYEESPQIGSGWTLNSINDFTLHVSKYQPMSAGSFIPLPKKIAAKKSVINVQNKDDFCFKYSIIAGKLRKQTPDCRNLEKMFNYNAARMQLFDFDVINSYPITFADIRKFEIKNNVSVNVYGIDDRENVFPLRISENSNKKREHFDLLYLQQIDSDGNEKSHYCCITNMGRLCRSQKTLHNGRVHVCRLCLQFYSSEKLLAVHERFCGQHRPLRAIMPNEDRTIQKFEKHHFQQRIPYIIYADFECALVPFKGASRDLKLTDLPRDESMIVEEATPSTSRVNEDAADGNLIDDQLEPMTVEEESEGEPKSYTEKQHQHVPTSYCYYIVCNNEKDETNYQPVLYRGPDAVQHFWSSVRADIEKIGAIYETIVPIDNEDPANKLKMIEILGNLQRGEAKCHICSHIKEDDDVFHIDHDHLTGEIRGHACAKCNLNYQLPNFVPIVLHNGSNYDFKLLIKDIYAEPKSDDEDVVDGNQEESTSDRGKKRKKPMKKVRTKRRRCDFILDEAEVSGDEEDEDEEEDDVLSNDGVGESEAEEEGEEHLCENEERKKGKKKSKKRRGKKIGDINVIAKNTENFISFEVQVTKKLKARFIDSFRFMASSLSKLADNLNDAQLTHVRKFYDGELFDLAKRKGVFPYEHITGFQSYEELGLPPIEKFYSSLSDESISEEDYSHARRVFDAFGCHNLGEYSDVYLEVDVLLLASIFENFRDLCLETYKLDAAWHFSAPGLAWNAMLKVTNVELELLTDYTMIMFYEASVRGGYVAASERLVSSNLSELPNFDPSREQNRLFYCDMNNLYGGAMCAPLPLKDFKFLDPSEIEALDVMAIEEDAPYGYVLEVDLEYPEELHDAHNDFPYCPEKLRTSMHSGAPKKLAATLHHKNNYIIHYRYLQSALKSGLKLKKVHRVVKFQQSCWMQPYIHLNNELRKKATSEFSKDFYKLMNNSCFGKFLESIRKRRRFHLTSDAKKLVKLVKNQNFKSRLILNEKTNLVLVEMKISTLYFNKFIQAGGAILDLSKTLMWDFHYRIMKEKIFPDTSLSIAYTDTDSFVYNIKTSSEIFNQRLYHFKEYFDFSEYPHNHPLYDTTNKKVLCKMKDETKSKIITRFCALKAKMYTFEVADNNVTKVVKKGKGIRKHILEKSMKFQNYADCLQNSRLALYSLASSIRSYTQDIYTIRQNKLALSAIDDKRYVTPEDATRTLAWGHYRIPRKNDIVYQLNLSENCNVENKKQNPIIVDMITID